MGKYLIKNVTVVNEGKSFAADVLISAELIASVTAPNTVSSENTTIIDGSGKILLPGVIDDHVHFREPGLTHKADIATESAAAVAGGVTSYMEMPNTNPQTVTIDELNRKAELASVKSHANFSFYLGATNTNLAEIEKLDPQTSCGVKIFMGSSTGNMLADDRKNLEAIFSQSPVLIATHCEDEQTIRKNLSIFKAKYGDNIPVECHPLIRNEEACYISTSLAVELALKFNSRLHILHISTAKELQLLNDFPTEQKRITGEACIHHIIYSDADYRSKGNLIKLNPAIKSNYDREMILKGINDDLIDIIATDHSPHTFEEKSNHYLSAPSGAPMIQHSLPSMLELWKQGIIPLERIVQKMCHGPAILFRITKRGFVRQGYFADLVLINPDSPWEINKSNLLYKCGWSSLEGRTMSTKVEMTFVNGEPVYRDGRVSEKISSRQLRFAAKPFAEANGNSLELTAI